MPDQGTGAEQGTGALAIGQNLGPTRRRHPSPLRRPCTPKSRTKPKKAPEQVCSLGREGCLGRGRVPLLLSENLGLSPGTRPL